MLHLHPHWRTVFGPAVLLGLTVVITAGVWVMLPQNPGGQLGFAVVALIMLYYALRYGIRPMVIRVCTHYVFTDERILLQDGVIARERRELSLDRVNDHVLTQSVLDRLFSSATFSIDSLGEQSTVLTAVPQAHHVQAVLYELMEHEHRLDDDDEIDDESRELPAQGPSNFRRRASG